MSGPLACVLAGGKSSRMGRDKAMLLYRGRPLIEQAVARLQGLGCEVVIAGSRPDLEQYGTILPDLHPGCGPLSGIEAALAFAEESAPDGGVLFLPIDLPLLPAHFLALLIERAARTFSPATVPFLGGRPQPLCAVYRPSLLAGISAALDAGEYKVMPVLERVLSSLPFDQRADFFAVEPVLAARPMNDEAQLPSYLWFTNINTPEDRRSIEEYRSRAVRT